VSELGDHATVETAYSEVFTVIHDLSEGRDVAWVQGAIWPPVGTVVELTTGQALVVGIRLVLERAGRALVRVDVQDPGQGEFVARDDATVLVEGELIPETVEAIGVEVPASPAG
jgi:hypothetical protein